MERIEKKHVLVAEDSRPQALVLKFALESAGYRVTVAPDGRAALEEVAKGGVSLVITDIEMPEMNGYEICAAIKRNAEWRRIPVILLTSHSRIEDILQGLSAQADFYITKPYSRGFLLERVAALLAQAGAAALEEDPNAPIKLEIRGKEYTVTATRRQMLTLLLSTYENSLRQNQELLKTQSELHQRNKELREQGARLEASEKTLREQAAQLEKANVTLEALARLDGLTGLLNRRTFNERLEEEFRRAARYALPLSVIMIDVDHFKSFNDQFGHPAGDAVLKATAATLLVESRNTDFVARYGGEEFVVLLPNTELQEAALVAERIRRAIEETPSPKRRVTASLGVAALSQGFDGGSALVAAADQALYASKAGGRNRVTLAGGKSDKLG